MPCAVTHWEVLNASAWTVILAMDFSVKVIFFTIIFIGIKLKKGFKAIIKTLKLKY